MTTTDEPIPRANTTTNQSHEQTQQSFFKQHTHFPVRFPVRWMMPSEYHDGGGVVWPKFKKGPR